MREQAKGSPKTIVLPEADDPRIKEAAEIIEKEGIARVLLLSPDKIKEQKKDEYAREYLRRREKRGLTLDEAEKTLSQPLYYAAMMVNEGSVDGFVAGAVYPTADVARAAIHCLELNPQIIVASSCFIIALPDKSFGEQGVFIFADCGIVPCPNSQELACIGVSAAELCRDVLGLSPRIAFLSYATKGSSRRPEISKVRQAAEIMRAEHSEFLVDGELQADAAIVPEVAKFKKSDAILGGRANVLIFPSLNAGNISYKLVQRLAGAEAIGPLILGLNRPCSDLSRGCSVNDIINCVAVTAVRAQLL